MFKSWKTTLAGLVASIGAWLSQSNDPTAQQIGHVLTPIGALLTGIFARDNDKSSESVGVVEFNKLREP